MDLIQLVTILGSVLALMGTMLGGVMYIHADVREIRQDMKQQNARIDKLYEMFIDLLKSKNTP